MATRIIEFRVYATDGTPYVTSPWTLTMTRKYAGEAQATVAPTLTDGRWATTVDDTKDANLAWSGTGITADDRTYLRIPGDALSTFDHATDEVTPTAASKTGYALTSAYDAAKAANGVAPNNAGITSILEDTGTTLPATLALILEDTGTTLPAAIAAIEMDGAGALTLTYRCLVDTNGDGVVDIPNVGIEGVICTITSDLAGNTRVGSPKTTDSLGYCRWRGLVAGTYYVWRDHPDYTFSDPDTETVSA